MVPFQVKASLSKPVKNSQTSLETPRKFFFSFRDNTICKEGIFSDVLGVKLRREKIQNSYQHMSSWRTLLPRLFATPSPSGQSLNQERPGVGPFSLRFFWILLIHRFHTLEIMKTPLVKKNAKKGSIAKVWEISETVSKKYSQSKNIFHNFYLQYFLCFVAVAVVGKENSKI